MAPLKLEPIKLTKIRRGGYEIVCRPPLQPGAARYLCLDGVQSRVDITNGYNFAALRALLKCITALNAWGTNRRCWVVDELSGKSVAKSEPQNLSCPVKPYDGLFTFDGFANAIPKLTYPGNGIGRLLIEIDGKHYFKYDGNFEIHNAMRGFDCTTFPMALFKCDLDMSGKIGDALAVALGAAKCDMEQKKVPEVKAFFADRTKSAGLYFMWRVGHVVLVKNSIVHEFTNVGYRRSATDNWLGFNSKKQELWCIRKLPATLNP